MQALALLIDLILNVILVGIATASVVAHDDAGSVRIWTICAWTSAALLIANLIFCIWRMILLWRRGRRVASLWGIAVLIALPIGAYLLWGAYLLALLVAGGTIGGD